MSIPDAREFVAEPGRGHLPVPRPFVKWVGGKRSIEARICQLLGDFQGCYHEPFVGGGAVYFALLRERGWLHGGARLSDGNQRLIRTWRGIQQDVDGVLERLAYHAARHDKAHYYEVRAMDVDACADDADVAAWFIYLNRTGFNGLYRVNREGRFNVPMGSYKNPRIHNEQNLRAVSAVLQDTELVHQDFEQALASAKPGDAVYLDPPYVPLSGTAKFTDYTRAGFWPEDQQRLAARALELKRAGVRVVLSNHDTPEVRALYPAPFEHRVVPVRRFVNRDGKKRGHVDELLIF